VIAPKDTFLGLHDLTVPDRPVALRASKVKLAGLAGILGLVLSGLAVIIAEGRRRARSTPAAGFEPLPDDLLPPDSSIRRRRATQPSTPGPSPNGQPPVAATSRD
jgi:hypothetical protein